MHERLCVVDGCKGGVPIWIEVRQAASSTRAQRAAIAVASELAVTSRLTIHVSPGGACTHADLLVGN